MFDIPKIVELDLLLELDIGYILLLQMAHCDMAVIILIVVLNIIH